MNGNSQDVAKLDDRGWFSLPLVCKMLGVLLIVHLNLGVNVMPH